MTASMGTTASERSSTPRSATGATSVFVRSSMTSGWRLAMTRPDTPSPEGMRRPV